MSITGKGVAWHDFQVRESTVIDHQFDRTIVFNCPILLYGHYRRTVYHIWRTSCVFSHFFYGSKGSFASTKHSGFSFLSVSSWRTGFTIIAAMRKWWSCRKKVTVHFGLLDSIIVNHEYDYLWKMLNWMQAGLFDCEMRENGKVSWIMRIRNLIAKDFFARRR